MFHRRDCLNVQTIRVHSVILAFMVMINVHSYISTSFDAFFRISFCFDSIKVSKIHVEGKIFVVEKQSKEASEILFNASVRRLFNAISIRDMFQKM